MRKLLLVLLVLLLPLSYGLAWQGVTRTRANRAAALAVLRDKITATLRRAPEQRHDYGLVTRALRGQPQTFSYYITASMSREPYLLDFVVRGPEDPSGALQSRGCILQARLVLP
jgi:hypothetical protein